MKFEIVYERQAKVVVEAGSRAEAEALASCLDDEVIVQNEDDDWVIWDIIEKKENQLATSQEKKGDNEDV